MNYRPKNCFSISYVSRKVILPGALLMRCWRLFSEWGRQGVAFCFGCKCGHYLICEHLNPFATQITQDAKPKIID
jgi:hypothetical protein